MEDMNIIEGTVTFSRQDVTAEFIPETVKENIVYGMEI